MRELLIRDPDGFFVQFVQPCLRVIASEGDKPHKTRARLTRRKAGSQSAQLRAAHHGWPVCAACSRTSIDGSPGTTERTIRLRATYPGYGFASHKCPKSLEVSVC